MTTSPILQLLLRLSLWGLLLQKAETGSEGQTAGELYQRWERYRRECQETLATAEPPSGLACNGSFDMYVCWDYAAPNATARASCPWYLPWYHHALFVIPWMIVRYLYENTQCWERNEVKAIWWIIRTPILMTILINFLIFIRILGILLAKLRTRQMRCRDYRLRLARSTLTLVPLLGVHEVVFAPVTEEQARGALRFAKLGFEIFLSSFQGLLVSVLYCFINKEVQSEIRRGWHHCRLRRSLGEEQRQL
uniref:Gastric inhibitory polypeptide receptor n=1 Tax=Colobus angolensis palliatus TaxID=336983 RepID=A0A2K5ICL3_COLAP